MLYSEKYDLAFLHIGKTGGTSFREFLTRVIPDMRDMPELPACHYTVADLFAVLRARGQDPARTRVLTTLRHPLACVVSMYHDWRRDRFPPWEAALPHAVLARSVPFREFVLRLPGHVQVYDQLLLVEGALPPNVFVMKLESLRADARRVLNRELGLGVRVRIPHRNATRHRHYLSYYDAQTARIIQDRYRWCFEQGYYAREWPPAGTWLSRLLRRLGRPRGGPPEPPGGARPGPGAADAVAR